MELQAMREAMMSDEQIVELYWRRDERALPALVKYHSPSTASSRLLK